MKIIIRKIPLIMALLLLTLFASCSDDVKEVVPDYIQRPPKVGSAFKDTLITLTFFSEDSLSYNTNRAIDGKFYSGKVRYKFENGVVIIVNRWRALSRLQCLSYFYGRFDSSDKLEGEYVFEVDDRYVYSTKTADFNRVDKN